MTISYRTSRHFTVCGMWMICHWHLFCFFYISNWISLQTYLQQTTCSIFTGRYLDRISDVLLIKHLRKQNMTQKKTFHLSHGFTADFQCSSWSHTASCSAKLIELSFFSHGFIRVRQCCCSVSSNRGWMALILVVSQCDDPVCVCLFLQQQLNQHRRLHGYKSTHLRCNQSGLVGTQTTARTLSEPLIIRRSVLLITR